MRPRRLPCGLLGTFAIIAIVEVVVASHGRELTRFPIHDWKFNGRAARRVTTDCGVLCLGDSLVKFGISPGVLEARLGSKAYNLALCDGQVTSSYYMLRRALDAGARPSAVVLDAAPHLLSAEPRHNLRQWPELFDTTEAIELGWATKNARFCGELALGMIFPSLKDRYEIRVAIQASLDGRVESHRGEVAAYRHHWRKNRGAMLFPERPSYQGEVELENPAYFPKKWKCHPVNLDYIDRLLDLAAQERIRVYWLLPPVVPRFQARRDELGLEASLDRFLEQLLERHPRLTVIDGRRSGYGHELFIDPLHLNHTGSVGLTDGVATLLDRGSRAALDSRWVTLPDYRSATGDDGRGLEDIEMSRLAVGLGGDHQRRRR
ncbi:hypothetical protein ACYOEI_09425 [Singulisphaera rosea]